MVEWLNNTGAIILASGIFDSSSFNINTQSLNEPNQLTF